MKSLKTSFICTVLNEEETILELLHSLSMQSKIPDEIVIVDGGSKDATLNLVKSFKAKHRNLSLKLLQKKGNRAVSRNFGIKHAGYEAILISDAGCVLAKDWVEKITKPFSNPSVGIVAGYYKGKDRSIFQKSLLPYVLVMEDKINRDTFLPSTRSMAIRKSLLVRMGGFPEEYSHNEDYVFAKKLERKKIKIYFAKKAIVYWLPRKTLKGSFVMFFRFAYGDAEAGIFRAKVLLIFLRYLVFGILCIAALNGVMISFYYLAGLVFLYFLWAIIKNYRYVKKYQAFFFLPLLQITSDIAVLGGSCAGFFRYVAR